MKSFYRFTASALFSCTLVASLAKETSSTSSGMVLDLGETSHYVKITPEYSNAVLEAVLPYFSDAAKELDLPVPHPITRADIASVNVQPFREMSASILLKNGWAFEYLFGHVHRIQNLRGYASLQDPDQVPRFYGDVKMTKEEAIQFARDTLKKLGIRLEDVFAEQEPRVTLPVKLEGNTVPHYEVEWIDPRAENFHSVDIHINANTKQIETLFLSNKNLESPRPRLNVVLIPDRYWPSVNPEYARQLLPMMFKAIDEHAQKLSLPIPRPLTTNNVARVEIADNIGWPHAEIELTNGWRFVYRHTMVNGYYAPDSLWASMNRGIHIKEFEGKWNLNTNQAIELVKKTLAKLNYPTNNIHMDFAPNIIYPAGDYKKIIPRYSFEWYYENASHDDLQSKVEVEVNADTGQVESLYYDDKAYWGCRPPIDVPISKK